MSAFDRVGFSLFSLAILAAAGVSVLFSDRLPIGALLIFAHFFFFIAAALSAQFGRLNPLYALLPIWVVGAALTDSFAFFDIRVEPAAAELLRVVAWYIAPLNFAVFTWLEERSFFSVSSLARITAIALELCVIALIAFSAAAPNAYDALATELFSPPLALAGVPQIALIVVLLAAIALIVKIFIERQNTLETAMFFALLGALAALYFYPDRGAQIVFLLASAAIIAAGFTRLAYKLAYYDELTGALGRRALFEALHKLSGRYAIAMVDIDHFKLFNDRYGHDAGDQALKMVATKLALTRGGAKVYRYGGEEFTIIFNGKNKKEAAPYLEEAREAVEGSPFIKRSAKRPKAKLKNYRKVRGANDDYERITVTISIGASDGENGGTQNEVIKAADRALYRAKEQGRNRVVVS
ncbi:MAG: GGDEF domain-containing protein [Helicobacteraceae bacterium]|nr:GGDEF domain-containing protein [Helicobacteraceae bacterium]